MMLEPSNLVAIPDALADTDAFKNSVFPDAHNWTAKRVGEVVTFTRGPPICSHDHFVTHGTPLSIAYIILRDGIRVGDGEHAKNGRKMHGVFCMDGGSARDRISNARDRSTSSRCHEFQIKMWPTAWTVPCVLAWKPWPDTHAAHMERFTDGCWKSCIESTIGTQRDMPYNMMLIINSGELHSYNVLQDIMYPPKNKIHVGPAAQLYMICGGKTWWADDGNEQRDSTYWAKDTNNMPPSCGRCIIASALETSAWSRKKSKVLYCPSCHGNHCSPVFWS